MFSPFRKWVVFPAVVAVLSCVSAWGQVSGRITGTVSDPSGNVIIGADVTLQNEGTSEARAAQSNEIGFFAIPNVTPGNYTVRVQSSGFSVYERRNIILSANQILSLGNIQLAVGTLTETITVQATGATVETERSGNSSLLTSNQLTGLMSRGRDIVSLMTVLPGASQNTDSDALGGNWGSATPNMNGLRSHYNSFKLDGQAGSDIDVLNFFTISVSMDAIQEVSVRSNSYLAEDGRMPGVHVNIVSKSGTNEFHGSGYWFKRHETFNANSFFNNRQGLERPLTRFDTLGATVGGPIKKDRLFFHFSQEVWRIKLPGRRYETTLPTSAERRGDFSQSFDQNGKLITVFDPQTLDVSTGAKQAFANNIVPAARINANGRGLLGFHPDPNFFDRNLTQGAFNYRELDAADQPKTQTQFKIDFVPNEKDRISFRPRWWKSDRQAQNQSTAFNGNFVKQFHHYNYPTQAYQGSYTRAFSPTLVNEFNMGFDKRQELGDLNDKFGLENTRRKDYVPGLGQLFPDVNPLGLMPRMFFNGLPNSPTTDWDPRTPIAARDTRWFISNNLSWIKGKHTFKFGGYWEMNDASEGPRAAALGRHMGTFEFNRDGNNPFDSNHPFANALLGNFLSYSESSALTQGIARTYTLEFFAQDSWKMTPRLSIDYGLRVYSFTPWRLIDDEGSALVLSQFDPSRAPLFFRPGLNSAGRRAAVNPITGQTFPTTLIGAFVPGTGDRLNGRIASGDPAVPDGFRERPPLQFGPRLGFAYDVFGTGKTAIRGGIGITKQTIFSSQQSMWITTTSPPLIESPQIFFGNLDTFREAGGELFFPAEAAAFDPQYDNPPTVYNWSFGIQQDLGAGTVLDASYVGSSGRHLRQRRNLNILPPGTRFLASSQDSTTGRPLPDNFLRPYQGVSGTLNYVEDTGWSNYNALQVGINRRYTSGLQFGVAYTWSKAMGLAGGGSDSDGSFLPLYTDYRSYLYGKVDYDQTHVFVFNYLWSLPNAQIFAGNPVAKALFHNWELAGILTFASGFPEEITFSYTDGVDRWGGGDSPRVIMVEKPTLDRGEREFGRWFNTSAFRAPGRGDFGNAPVDVYREPGITNWDFTVYKNVPLNERMRFRVGFEFYNFLNHTQWNDVDNSARFDAAGNQVNGRFGQVINARNPRQAQLTVRFEF